MSLMPYHRLPKSLQTPAGEALYATLWQRRRQLAAKRLFDLTGALALGVALAPVWGSVALAVGLSSPGGVLFWQERVGRYGRPFFICKFRTMAPGSQGQGGLTAKDDLRVTKAGAVLRRFRLDELPQLWNILKGEMSFVGPRPELPRYVEHYTAQELATLLFPVGLTCPASIAFRDEAELLSAENADQVYIQVILPKKMAYNIRYTQEFSFLGDIRVLWQTVRSVWGNEDEV